MEGVAAMALGALTGVVCSLPSAYLFERALREEGQVSLAAGLGSVMFSFLALTVCVAVVYSVSVAVLMEFGCTMVASFLLFWAVEAVRAWRAANGVS